MYNFYIYGGRLRGCILRIKKNNNCILLILIILYSNLNLNKILKFYSLGSKNFHMLDIIL